MKKQPLKVEITGVDDYQDYHVVGIDRSLLADGMFYVEPQTINMSLFLKEREDMVQEGTRMIINKAFEELRNDFQYYGRVYETMIQNHKEWRGLEIEKRAEAMGAQLSDWVLEYLELAQFISNADNTDQAWRDVCNNLDLTRYYREINITFDSRSRIHHNWEEDNILRKRVKDYNKRIFEMANEHYAELKNAGLLKLIKGQQDPKDGYEKAVFLKMINPIVSDETMMSLKTKNIKLRTIPLMVKFK